MATKTITLTPTYCDGKTISGSTYPLDIYYDGKLHKFAYELPNSVTSVTNVNVSYSFNATIGRAYGSWLITGYADVYNNSSITGTPTPSNRIASKEKDVNGSGGYRKITVSDSITGDASQLVQRKYIIVGIQCYASGDFGDFSAPMNAAPTLRLNVEIRDISIESITPNEVETEINKTVPTTLTINDRNGSSLALTLKGNNKELFTGTVTTDTYTINCSSDWFKTAGWTSDSAMTVTVSLQETGGFQRKTSGTFTVTKPPAFTLDANKQNVVLSRYDDASNTITVNGDFKGKLTVAVKHGSTTGTPYQVESKSFNVDVPLSWFYNQSYNSTTVTVSVTDEIYRKAEVQFTAKLPDCTISTNKDTYESPEQVTINFGEAVGSGTLYYKVGYSSETAIENISASDSSTTDVLGNSLFSGTKSNSLSITYIYRSDNYKQEDSCTVTLNAGPDVYPSKNETLFPTTWLPVSPPGLSGQWYYIGWSKVEVSIHVYAGVTPIVEDDKVVEGTKAVLTGLGPSVNMTYFGDGTDADNKTYYTFVATTESVVQSAVTLKATVIDNNGRSCEFEAKIPESALKRLDNITVAPQSRSIDAGEDAVLEVDGFVGSYDISFACSGKTLAGGDEDHEDQTEETFTQNCPPSWFQAVGTTSSNINITVTVTDELDRKATNSFTVNLPALKLTLAPKAGGDIKNGIVFGNILTITITGNSGQTVSMDFSATNGQKTVELPTVTSSEQTKDVTCPKTWFDGFPTNKELTINIDGTAGTQTAKASFILKYPNPVLTVKAQDSSDLWVETTSATVGDTNLYSIDYAEGETFTISYYYQQRSVYSHVSVPANTRIVMPQLFDAANVTTVQSMQVSIVATDVRGRQAQVNNFTVNASASMAPQVYSSSFAPINPATVDSTFANSYIGDVTRLSATIRAKSGSNARVTEAILSIDGNNVPMTLNGVDGSGIYTFTYTGANPIRVEAIYEPRPVNLTLGYGLNSNGEVERNPKRAATVNPISVRKESTYKVIFSNPDLRYFAQCALWEGDIFKRIVTNESLYPSTVELSFDTESCDKVYVSLVRKNETSETDPVDIEEANMTIKMIDQSLMSSELTPIPFEATVKDERGLSDSMWVGTAYAYPYSAPRASISYHRCNQDGTPNDSGGNCLLTCDFAFEGLWLNAFPPSPQNRGYVTVSTSNYDETKQFDFTKWKKAQFTLVAGYGLNNSGEVVSNPLRAATTTPYIVTEGGSPGGPATHAAYKVTFDGDYIVEYARWEESTLIRQGTINSSGQYITAEVGESLYISLKRSNETSESAPVDIAEANVQLTLNLGDSEDGSFEFLIPDMSIEHTYTITATLTDLITSTTYSVVLSTGAAIMDFLSGGKGIGLGKVAEHSQMVEVNPDWTLKAGKMSLKVGDTYVDVGTLLAQIKQQLGI